MRAFCLAGLLAVGVAAAAPASTLTFAMKESGGDVIGTIGGSLTTDINDLPVSSSVLYTDETEIRPGSGFLVVSDFTLGLGNLQYSTYALTGSATWGGGTAAIQGQTSSLQMPSGFAAIGLDISGGPVLLLPTGTAPGGTYSGAFSFANTNFASMGVTPGIYTYSRDNGDTIEVVFTPVPLPSGVVGALTALLLLAALGRRRTAA